MAATLGISNISENTYWGFSKFSKNIVISFGGKWSRRKNMMY